MDCSLAFSHSPGGLFLVLLELSPVRPGIRSSVNMTVFDDENEFIQSVVLCLSDNEAIMSVIAHVLLDISGKQQPAKWLSINLPAEELNALGLRLPAERNP